MGGIFLSLTECGSCGNMHSENCHLDESCYNSVCDCVLFTWLTSLNRTTSSADQKIRCVMNSLCWFCALSDWKGISCRYFRFTHGSHYCIFVPLNVCVLVMLLAAKTLLSQWFRVLEEDWGTTGLNFKPKTIWEVYGEAEMWSPLLISSGLFIFCLMPTPVWFGTPVPKKCA